MPASSVVTACTIPMARAWEFTTTTAPAIPMRRAGGIRSIGASGSPMAAAERSRTSGRSDGGGGTFKDIWTPNTFAQAGVYISDTATEGRIYALSSEHHVRNEVKLRNVSNWQIYALQMEEERGE